MAASTGTEHYKDWPNAYGFDVTYQELEPTELEVSGTIPAYTAGVLFRNGLGPRTIDDKDNKAVYRANHWFDGLSQVHRFQIHRPTTEHPVLRVTHNSRLTCDALIERIRRTGSRDEVTFGAKFEPCQSLFQKAKAVFRPAADPKLPSEIAIGVALSANFPGLSPTGQRQEKPMTAFTLVNKSDVTFMQALDPQTLEPIGIATQKTLHPDLTGPLSAAHASIDPATGDFYNYNLDMGAQGSIYRIFTTSASTGKTTVLAAIKHPGAYIHSSYLTEHYFILCVWNSVFSAGGAAILWKRNVADSLASWDPSRPSMWFVVDRTDARRGVVATYEGDPYFAYHSINAYEEPSAEKPGSVDLVLDVCAYDSLDSIKRFYIENLMSDSAPAREYGDIKMRPTFRRFRLPQLPTTPNKQSLKAITEFSGVRGLAPELPSINGSLATRKHRYVYGTMDSGKSTFVDGLVKFDAEARSNLIWSELAQTPSEPIFIADPDRPDKEDAGVLLSVVLDGTGGKSYLLVLDAVTMTEIGRAKVDSVVGFGFHGIHVTESKMARWQQSPVKL